MSIIIIILIDENKNSNNYLKNISDKYKYYDYFKKIIVIFKVWIVLKRLPIIKFE